MMVGFLLPNPITVYHIVTPTVIPALVHQGLNALAVILVTNLWEQLHVHVHMYATLVAKSAVVQRKTSAQNVERT